MKKKRNKLHLKIKSLGFVRFGLLFFLVQTGMWSQTEKPIITILEEEFIFEEAEFPQCHASSLEILENGEVMAAWFGGEYERHPEVSIYTSVKNGNEWTSPKKVADGKVNDSLRYPTWNPVLFKSTSKNLFLFYKVGPSPAEWWGMVKTSDDAGKSWSPAIRLSDGILGPIKNKPVEIGKRIISPSSTENMEGKWHSHIEISEDDGKSWRKIPVDSESEYKTIQPTLIYQNGELKALFRSDQDVVVQSVSSDLGETWSKFKKLSVPNPNAGIDAVSLRNGQHLLVYNPMVSGKDWQHGRNKLSIAISTDGDIWKTIFTLEDEKEGEFSYPAIVQDAKGYVHVSYTHNRKRIKYLKLKLN